MANLPKGQSTRTGASASSFIINSPERVASSDLIFHLDLHFVIRAAVVFLSSSFASQIYRR